MYNISWNEWTSHHKLTTFLSMNNAYIQLNKSYITFFYLCDDLLILSFCCMILTLFLKWYWRCRVQYRDNQHDMNSASLSTACRHIYTIICLKSVGVRKRHVAILALSSREMSLTDRILPRYILSRVRVSVRPRIFVYAKKNQTRLACMLFISSRLCGQINNWIGNCRTDPAGWRRAKASGY